MNVLVQGLLLPFKKGCSKRHICFLTASPSSCYCICHKNIVLFSTGILLFNFLLLFYYSYPSFSSFALLHSAHLCSHSQSSHCCPYPWVIHTHSSMNLFTFFPPLSPFPSPILHLISCVKKSLVFWLSHGISDWVLQSHCRTPVTGKNNFIQLERKQLYPEGYSSSEHSSRLWILCSICFFCHTEFFF